MHSRRQTLCSIRQIRSSCTALRDDHNKLVEISPTPCVLPYLSVHKQIWVQKTPVERVPCFAPI